MINYCKSLKNSTETTEEDSRNKKLEAAEIGAKIAGDNQWKKEKGLEVLQSKKSR